MYDFDFKRWLGQLNCLYYAFFAVFFSSQVHGQKAAIDSSVINNWPVLLNPLVSADGSYVCYSVKQRSSSMTTTVIKNIDNGWKKEIPNVQLQHFSGDSRKMFFQSGDTLCVLPLCSTVPTTKIAIEDFKYPLFASHITSIAYRPKDRQDTLVVLNLIDGEEKRFKGVINYDWSQDGTRLYLSSQENDKFQLTFFDIKTGNVQTILSIENANTHLPSVYSVVERAGNLSFLLTQNIKNKSVRSVWCYRHNEQKLSMVANDESAFIPQGMQIDGNIDLSGNGKYIFLNLIENGDKLVKSLHSSQVDVYGYRDLIIAPQQNSFIRNDDRIHAVIPVFGGPAILLNKDLRSNQEIITPLKEITGDYLITGERNPQEFTPLWLVHDGRDFYIVSLKDGQKKLLPAKNITSFLFSPSGDKVVYWSTDKKSFFIYDPLTSENTNLCTRMASLSKSGDYIDYFGDSTIPRPFSGKPIWVDDGKALIIYSKYDIWKVNTNNRIAPVNLTNGFGVKHHILFRLVYETGFQNADQVLLTGFNEKNKQNGIYQIQSNKLSDPEPLTNGNCVIYRTSANQTPTPKNSFGNDLLPLKAVDNKAWIFQRQSATQYPNLFYTKNWKTNISVTDYQPQKSINWLTSELVNYKQLDGKLSQGILYKPQNFDPKKKYPIIFYYYEHLSYRLNEYPIPELANGQLNIPWMVSRGYLVFTPDNHYGLANKNGGKTAGEAVLNSVAGAARHLCKFPFIDQRHMGIQGHSFGGGETNYLVTHSNLFAAACSAAGTVSDQISAYLGPFRRKGDPVDSYRVLHSESGHDMIGATLWQRPDLYFRSSSVFAANKVTTPLLLMHNEKDEQTDFGQSFELYSALRRLGKPVWLLQYDNGGHTLYKKEDKYDYTIRMTQFFDHYLKGMPPPKWMTQGRPTKLKGIDDRFELDTTGAKP